MNVSQIIDILEKRVVYLQTLKTAAYAEGNLDAYNQCELDIIETEASLALLRSHI
jgi:hypothetical protein